MTEERLIKTVDFLADNANENSTEEKEISKVETEGWTDKLKSASNKILQQCKDCCQTLSQKSQHLVKSVLPETELTLSQNLMKSVLSVAELTAETLVWGNGAKDVNNKTSGSNPTGRKGIGTTIMDASTDAMKTESNNTRVSNDGKIVNTRKVELTKYFLLFIVCEVTLLWSSYVIGQHHGLFRYIEAQKDMRYRSKIY